MKSVRKTLLDPNVESEDISRFYRDVRSNPCLSAIVEDMWGEYEPYADPNFTKEIAKDFHPRFWEMDMTCALLDQGKSVKPKRKADGPDICIEDDEKLVWVECVAPTSGHGPNAARDISAPVPEQCFGYLDDEKVILRYTSVICDKHKKLMQYLQKNVVSPCSPFIIAVNGASIPFARVFRHGPDNPSIPHPLRSLLGVGSSAWVGSMNSNTAAHVLLPRPVVEKVCGEKIERICSAGFRDDRYAEISAVLFSFVHIGNVPKQRGTDFLLLHNEFATNPIPKEWLRTGAEFWVKGDKLFHKQWTD